MHIGVSVGKAGGTRPIGGPRRRFFFFLVSWGGMRLSPLGTAPPVWSTVPAPDDR
jgi:hypothetical protein